MDTEKESMEPKSVFGLKATKPSTCVCPKCGHESLKTADVPCTEVKCPICESNLINK